VAPRAGRRTVGYLSKEIARALDAAVERHAGRHSGGCCHSPFIAADPHSARARLRTGSSALTPRPASRAFSSALLMGLERDADDTRRPSVWSWEIEPGRGT